MEMDKNFTAELYAAFDAKAAWLSQEVIPQLHSEYLNMQSLSDNLFASLLNRSIIRDDPYKNDKKISKIVPITDESFPESEISKVMGERLSDYNRMLDFICSYINFSLESLVPERLKELLAFNSCIQWNAVSASTKSPNTKAIYDLTLPMIQGTDQITSNLTKTTLSACQKTMDKINEMVKNVAIFQREAYKIEVRRNILDNPEFQDSDCESKEKMDAKIRSLFKQILEPSIKLYPELINEIIDETIAPHRDQLRAQLFEKFQIEKKKTTKKKVQVDPHELVMDSVHALANCSPQISQITEKFLQNSEILTNSKMSAFQKFLRQLRKILNLKEKPINYKITIVDPLTQAKHNETIQFSSFIEALEKKANTYNILCQPNLPGYRNFEAKHDLEILEFVTKQLADWNRQMQVVTGLDDYFKNQASSSDKSKIRGIKVEIMGIKNALVKSNQKKSEFVSLMEEQEQMQILGIKSDV